MKTLLAICILLTGCMTVHKAEDFLKKKNKLAEVCYQNFPVDTVVSHTVDTITTLEIVTL